MSQANGARAKRISASGPTDAPWLRILKTSLLWTAIPAALAAGAESGPAAVPGADAPLLSPAAAFGGKDVRTPAMERAAAAYLAKDASDHPDIHTPAAPPTPPSIGIVQGGVPAGRKHKARSGRGSSAVMAPAFPLPPGRAVLAGRALLAVLAMTVLTVAVVLAAGRVGAADSVNQQPVPGQIGGTSTGGPP